MAGGREEDCTGGPRSPMLSSARLLPIVNFLEAACSWWSDYRLSVKLWIALRELGNHHPGFSAISWRIGPLLGAARPLGALAAFNNDIEP